MFFINCKLSLSILKWLISLINDMIMSNMISGLEDITIQKEVKIDILKKN